MTFAIKGGGVWPAIKLFRPQVALFDMPNLNRFDILSISIFSKIALSISISISIFSKITISISISIFLELPYRYRYDIDIFQNCPIDIDIDIDIFNFSISISISIFFKSVDISTIDMSYRYIEQG